MRYRSARKLMPRKVGGSSLVVAGLFQCLDDRIPLDVFELRAEGRRAVGVSLPKKSQPKEEAPPERGSR